MDEKDSQRSVHRTVELFAAETTSEFASAAVLHKMNTRMAEDVIAKFASATLTTRFRLLSGSSPFQFREILGRVARDCMLNDVAVNICCQLICDGNPRSIFLGTHAFGGGIPSSPRRRKNHFDDDREVQAVSDIEYVVHPMHLVGIHWGVAVVRLQYPDVVTCNLYESLSQSQYKSYLDEAWRSMLLPFLKCWHDDCGEKVEFPRTKIDWCYKPVQPDGVSCGVFSIGFVYSTVVDFNDRQTSAVVTAREVSTMRLRVLWMLLCATVEDPQEEKDAAVLDSHVKLHHSLFESQAHGG